MTEKKSNKKLRVQFKLKQFGKYFRELSIITLGIAITLAVGAWISKANEKRELSEYLNIVKMELEENIKYIERETERVELMISYTKFLNSTDKNSISPDSIGKYWDVIGNISRFAFTRNAFDMFQASGMMRLVADKELLLKLWETYNDFSTAETSLNMIIEFKREELFAELRNPPSDGIPMRLFYQAGIPRTILNALNIVKKQAMETLERLEQEG